MCAASAFTPSIIANTSMSWTNTASTSACFPTPADRIEKRPATGRAPWSFAASSTTPSPRAHAKHPQRFPGVCALADDQRGRLRAGTGAVLQRLAYARHHDADKMLRENISTSPSSSPVLGCASRREISRSFSIRRTLPANQIGKNIRCIKDLSGRPTARWRSRASSHAGIFDRYPKLKIIGSHLGGMILLSSRPTQLARTAIRHAGKSRKSTSRNFSTIPPGRFAPSSSQACL